MEQENNMKNQIGLQSKRLAQMKIEEEKRRKHMMARREHEERCNEEEQLRNCKMDEVAQMEKLEMDLFAPRSAQIRACLCNKHNPKPWRRSLRTWKFV